MTMLRALVLLACAGAAALPAPATALMPPEWICRFEPDSVELLPRCQQELRGLVAGRSPRFHDVIQLTVRGTTDQQEGRNAQGRQRLSEQRAQAVTRFLVFLGVPARLIRTEGVSAGRPEPESRRVVINEGWRSG